MKEIIDFPVKIKRLSSYGGHYFFGYYDLPAWDSSMSRHLAHKVTFIDRIQTKDDRAIIGYFKIPPDDGPTIFVPVDRTQAWNFQQGAMLQWHPAFPDDKIIYNIQDAGDIRGTIRDLKSGKITKLDQPVATVSPTGDKALGINFPRLYTFRPGYGYAGVEDPYCDQKQPEKDGIWAIDLHNGQARLLLSLAEIWERTKEASNPQQENPKILINHITWDPSGTRFLFLLRYIESDGMRWKTSVMVADRKGTHIKVLLPFSSASHYWWTSSTTILMYSFKPQDFPSGLISDNPEDIGAPLRLQQYFVDINSGTFSLVNARVFTEDTHMRQLPGSPWVVHDTYPDKNSFRRLFLYNMRTQAIRRIGNFYSPLYITGDYRCDLHPRWSPDGCHIGFDSVHEGFRGVYCVMDALKIGGR